MLAARIANALVETYLKDQLGAKIKATSQATEIIEQKLEGLRQKLGPVRILAVLEPRSNTMKLGVMNEQLPGSLVEADGVFCYAANLGWDAALALAPLGDRARVFDDLDALVIAVSAAAHAGDHVLVMSNGGFGGVHDKLLAALAARSS